MIILGAFVGGIVFPLAAKWILGMFDIKLDPMSDNLASVVGGFLGIWVVWKI